MSLYIVASGAVALLTAQQKEEKNGAGTAESRPQENTFKGSCGVMQSTQWTPHVLRIPSI
tara:strand:+ start:716 stop:895 length:180 start_codon:yes stop_codon:yes gene_type:complete